MNPIAFLALYFIMAEKGIYAVFGKCPPFPDQCEPLDLCVTFDYNSCPICKCVTAPSASTATTHTGTHALSYTTARSTIDLSHITDHAGVLSSLPTKPSIHSKWTTKYVDASATHSPVSNTGNVSAIPHSSSTRSTSFTAPFASTATAHTGTHAHSYITARSIIHLSHITDHAGVHSSLLTKLSTHSKSTAKSVHATATHSPVSNTGNVSTISHSSSTGRTSLTAPFASTATTHTGTHAHSYTTARSTIDLSHITDHAGVHSSLLPKLSTHSKSTAKSVHATATHSPVSNTGNVSTISHSSSTGRTSLTAASAGTSTAHTGTHALSYTTARNTVHLSHITDHAGMLLSLHTKPLTNSIWTTKYVDETATPSPVSNTGNVSTISHSSSTGRTSSTVAVGGTFGPRPPGCTFMNCRLDCGNPPKYSKDIFGCDLCKCATE